MNDAWKCTSFESVFHHKMKKLHDGLAQACEPGFFGWLDCHRETQWAAIVDAFENGMSVAIRSRNMDEVNRTISQYRVAMLRLMDDYANYFDHYGAARRA